MKCVTVMLAFVLNAAVVASADDKPLTEDQKKFADNLKSKDAKVRAKAAEEIGNLGADGAPLAKALCDNLLDPNSTASLATILALEKVRPDLYKPISKILLDKTGKKRAEGFSDLGLMKDDARPAVGFMMAIVGRMIAEDARSAATHFGANTVQASAYVALGVIKSEDAQVIKQMQAIAGPGTMSISHRMHALAYLVAWAEDQDERRKEVVPLLKAGLDPIPTAKKGAFDTTLQSVCIKLAGQYGALSKDMLLALRMLKLSNVATTREAATKAVESIEAALKP